MLHGVAWQRSSTFRGIVAVLCIFAGALCVHASPPSVTKVEPPSWWANHTINPVRLLVRGAALQGGRLSSAHRGIKVARIATNAAGTYLFADLHIAANVAPGEYPLLVETLAGRTRLTF
ncbi:MAG TPA: cyclomaltodextrinase N-terminal domain-containing protein, partial [Pyrinomonadaceae bacterium]|nr:cyclomaltodextrinase N-terminal domain-containing protein [Pyrinomonadaceae bacterium]